MILDSNLSEETANKIKLKNLKRYLTTIDCY